jgi:hypothetical protein
MYYEARSLQDIAEVMASCDRLGLMYVVQKEVAKSKKWFGTEASSIVYKLQVVQYVEEEETNENRGPGESEEVGSEEEVGDTYN